MVACTVARASCMVSSSKGGAEAAVLQLAFSFSDWRDDTAHGSMFGEVFCIAPTVAELAL